MDSCACGGGCDGVAADVYEAQTRRARVAHRCCECGEEVLPGQRYEYASICSDGGWGHAKTCELCVLIRKDLCPSGGCHGDLRESIWYCLGFDYVTGKEQAQWAPSKN
ncbi:MAG: hypothetical protein JRD89_03025 [Deltaproteobacteria bacterium]|nr:hypothetical protein [Deltaproteobacteria bacterium]